VEFNFVDMPAFEPRLMMIDDDDPILLKIFKIVESGSVWYGIFRKLKQL
jgi:hypothetical protein